MENSKQNVNFQERKVFSLKKTGSKQLAVFNYLASFPHKQEIKKSPPI